MNKSGLVLRQIMSKIKNMCKYFGTTYCGRMMKYLTDDI